MLTNILSWVGFALAVTSATLLAARPGRFALPWVGFLLSNICWFTVGSLTSQPAICAEAVVFFCINIMGIVNAKRKCDTIEE